MRGLSGTWGLPRFKKFSDSSIFEEVFPSKRTKMVFGKISSYKCIQTLKFRMQALFLMQNQNLKSDFRFFDFLLFLGIKSETNQYKCTMEEDRAANQRSVIWTQWLNKYSLLTMVWKSTQPGEQLQCWGVVPQYPPGEQQGPLCGCRIVQSFWIQAKRRDPRTDRDIRKYSYWIDRTNSVFKVWTTSMIIWTIKVWCWKILWFVPKISIAQITIFFVFVIWIRAKFPENWDF